MLDPVRSAAYTCRWVLRAKLGPRFFLLAATMNLIPDLTEEVRHRVGVLGFELVDLRQLGSGRRPRMQVRIDRPESTPGNGVSVDDCARVSRSLEQWLDGSGILGRNYVLEVSSPGIERPVRWIEHWERFTGRAVNVRLRGRGRVRATIAGVVAAEQAVVLRLEGETEDLTVPVDEARDATLAIDWETALDFSGREDKERA